MLGPKTEFSTFWKTYVFECSSKTDFGVLILKIRPVEYVHMDHTDHFGFQYFFDFDM